MFFSLSDRGTKVRKESEIFVVFCIVVVVVNVLFCFGVVYSVAFFIKMYFDKLNLTYL